MYEYQNKGLTKWAILILKGINYGPSRFDPWEWVSQTKQES
jgi:hypothetical protein